MYENLWKKPLEDSRDLIATDNIELLMKDQCRYLSDSTANKVHGRFIQVRDLAGAGAFTAVSVLAERYKSVLSTEMGAEADSRHNANELYKPARFSFDLYNKTYRFKVFELTLLPLYPVDLLLDEGVFNEVADKLPGIVNSDMYIVSVGDDDQLMRAFEVMVGSKKVRFILQKLIEGE